MAYDDPSALVSWEHTYSTLQWPILRQLLKVLAFGLVAFALIFVGALAARGELTPEVLLFPLGVAGATLCFSLAVSPIVLLAMGTTVVSRFSVREQDVLSEQIEPVVLPMDGSPFRSIAWSDVRKVVFHDGRLLVEVYGAIDVAVMLHCPDRATYDAVVAVCRRRGF